jgi:preprotein translocase subunit Sss1
MIGPFFDPYGIYGLMDEVPPPAPTDEEKKEALRQARERIRQMKRKNDDEYAATIKILAAMLALVALTFILRVAVHFIRFL